MIPPTLMTSCQPSNTRPHGIEKIGQIDNFRLLAAFSITLTPGCGWPSSLYSRWRLRWENQIYRLLPVYGSGVYSRADDGSGSQNLYGMQIHRPGTISRPGRETASLAPQQDPIKRFEARSFWPARMKWYIERPSRTSIDRLSSGSIW